jgi:hypothetical protein
VSLLLITKRWGENKKKKQVYPRRTSSREGGLVWGGGEEVSIFQTASGMPPELLGKVGKVGKAGKGGTHSPTAGAARTALCDLGMAGAECLVG